MTTSIRTSKQFSVYTIVATSATSEVRHPFWQALLLSATSILESSCRVDTGPHYMFNGIFAENIYLNFRGYYIVLQTPDYLLSDYFTYLYVPGSLLKWRMSLALTTSI